MAGLFNTLVAQLLWLCREDSAGISELCPHIPSSSGSSTWIVHKPEPTFRVKTTDMTRHGKAYCHFHNIYSLKQVKNPKPSQFPRWRNNSSSGWEELHSHFAKVCKQTRNWGQLCKQFIYHLHKFQSSQVVFLHPSQQLNDLRKK